MDGQTLGIVAGIVSTLAGAVATLFKMQSNAKDRLIEAKDDELARSIARIALLESTLTAEQKANAEAAETRTTFALAQYDKLHDGLKAIGSMADAFNKMGASRGG